MKQRHWPCLNPFTIVRTQMGRHGGITGGVKDWVSSTTTISSKMPVSEADALVESWHARPACNTCAFGEVRGMHNGVAWAKGFPGNRKYKIYGQQLKAALTRCLQECLP